MGRAAVQLVLPHRGGRGVAGGPVQGGSNDAAGETPMKIVKLEAENFKRLVAVAIEPDGALVPITGPNAAGKSAVLDAIWCALAGERSHPSVPIRKGEQTARVNARPRRCGSHAGMGAQGFSRRRRLRRARAADHHAHPGRERRWRPVPEPAEDARRAARVADV